jgi:hypothetical protein
MFGRRSNISGLTAAVEPETNSNDFTPTTDIKEYKESKLNEGWTKEDTVAKYAYLNILAAPNILKFRKMNKDYNEQFKFYYELLEDAESLFEFKIYWEHMIRFLDKHDAL